MITSRGVTARGALKTFEARRVGRGEEGGGREIIPRKPGSCSVQNTTYPF